MVELVRQGSPMRAVARRFGVAPNTVRLWVRRSAGVPVEQVDWSDGSSAPHQVHNRTAPGVEQQVVDCRRQLASPENALGFVGAAAISEALQDTIAQLPSCRTIGRILKRQGVVDRPSRRRFPAPPTGWYLPDLARGLADCDAFDVIEGLVLEGRGEIEVLTGAAVWGAAVEAWPAPTIHAQDVVEQLVSHWRTVGLPTYVQFDNDTRFQGGHGHPDTLGRVARMCLGLGITPVFTPPREMGFQAILERFNGLWQAKVWHRMHHDSLEVLRARSQRFIEAYVARRTARLDGLPARSPFPSDWRLDFQRPLHGRLIYVRRTDDAGAVSLLGRHFAIDARWAHRLVRCEVDLSHHVIRVFRLRRREPEEQPLLATINHQVLQRQFRA